MTKLPKDRDANSETTTAPPTVRHLLCDEPPTGGRGGCTTLKRRKGKVGHHHHPMEGSRKHLPQHPQHPQPHPQVTELNRRAPTTSPSSLGKVKSCGLALVATLATNTLTGSVEASSSSSSSATNGHHLMHQHHHSHLHGGDPSGAPSSSSSLSSTVRRISLNILNSSTSAVESLRSAATGSSGHEPFRSASAAGSYSSAGRTGNTGGHFTEEHRPSSVPHSSTEVTVSLTTSSSAGSEGASPHLEGGSGGSSLTTAYSYLSDFFPRLNGGKTSDVVSVGGDFAGDPSDYLMDDYDTLDSIATGSPPGESLLSSGSASGTILSSLAVEAMTPSGGGAASPSQPVSGSSSSAEVFMRLMRNVLHNGSGSAESDSDGSGSDSGIGSRSHSLFNRDSSSSSSSSLSSSVSSHLIPSLLSSSSASAVGTSTLSSTASLDFSEEPSSAASASSPSSSSPYETFFRLLSPSSSRLHHQSSASSGSVSVNGSLPVSAFSALTHSQLTVASAAASATSSAYGSAAAAAAAHPVALAYHSLLDDTLSQSVSSNLSSITSLISPTTGPSPDLTASSLGNGASPASSFSSSASYYASELASSLATTMMDDYASVTATMAAAASDGGAGLNSSLDGSMDWFDILMLVLKILVLGTIIISAIFGNLLVIISVLRHRRLRITTNYFIVSLALADILVALFAMTFNASVILAGHWIFEMWVCDFWNSCDVLFSTASIMHLSCISYDRYYAIIKPLDYPMKITTKRVYVMIGCVWLSSALISYIPIFTGLYTTEEALRLRTQSPDTCEFIVNIPYALISSTVSFWMPCGFMIAAYYKILQEAIKQEKFITRTQQMGNYAHAQNHSHGNHVEKKDKGGAGGKTGKNSDTQHLSAPRHSSTSENNVIHIQSGGHRNSHAEDPESGSSTPTKRTISKMKREHKAAKTLGIIMGAFIACWFPFFIWYVVSTIISWNSPKIVVDLVFWIGYLNSAMNPIIYAYFNREFREAFKETLRNIFCCCLKLKCLEQQRTDAISFSCTYRSTTDIGLVESKYTNS